MCRNSCWPNVALAALAASTASRQANDQLSGPCKHSTASVASGGPTSAQCRRKPATPGKSVHGWGKAVDADNLAKGGVWVIQDISDRKHAEAALVDAKDGLQHSLTELAQQKANVETAHSDLSSVLVTLKQAQTNLITSEKMASLGSLVCCAPEASVCISK